VPYYIDNLSFSLALGNWAAQKRQAIKTETKIPPMPDIVGEGVLLIARHFANKPNFRYYTYIDDMVTEGLLAVVKYGHNFDLTKSKNGLAFVTQILHNAFVKVIKDEKELTYRKMAFAETSDTVQPKTRQRYASENAEHEKYAAWKQHKLDKAAISKTNREKRKTETKEKRAAASGTITTVALVREFVSAGITDPKIIAAKTGRKQMTVYQSLRRVQKEMAA
jgi:hypothetical protein